MTSNDYLQYDGTYLFPDLETALREVDNIPSDSFWSLEHPTLEQLRFLHSVARRMK